MSDTKIMSLTHHVRVGMEDCHYEGGMMSGAHMLELVGDCAGELSYLQDGYRSLLVAVKDFNIKSPVFVSEALDINVNTIRIGNRSREMRFTIKKTLVKVNGRITMPAEPVLVAEGTIVVVVEKPIE
jgi:3-aminobutyryl-CoA ammonia-lyase